ncbi:MAG: glutamate-5-semialdehyde dehydrogenase [Leptotrichiaceae bacterium]|jgi:glutamate-5-semialdehyde dehydrogenase|nr:glutamate-5-semialdehyde dehydrogenase [Leptotrichiaceae bacterium]MBP6167648.1 glutamate-5-semialdehyde dehydrogenase [Leptotrichiaceae bacterium]MBP7026601.1 glutamate-5-semialdehyde dehydrogenase [Leptotrichiaceae bacterium]MBP8637079.1 glutamate-5-semialdehyde dehydrogenase [Leptotrichiaceae bacterium]MBP9875474.1 glutamate-5-semialdehyde dehydrogenase [Leptotrichiaceae bacterium]
MNEYILKLGQNAKKASKELLTIDTRIKNRALREIAKALIERKEEIKLANQKDIENGKETGLSFALLDRLELNDNRIEGMAESLNVIAGFVDPIGEILNGWKHQNGLLIEKKRVPLGVIGIIYESRPNVTIDSAGLAIKSSNAVILRGSANAINSNKCLNKIFNEVADAQGLPKNSVQLIESVDRELVKDMIRMNEYIDVLIPRGGKGLKQFIIENATIPVIETGAGVCHVFVDETGDLSKALPIIENAKIQRPSTCNSIETVLLHEKVANAILPELTAMLIEDKVELRYDSKALEIVSSNPDKKYSDYAKQVKLATEEDFGAEYLDMIMSLKIVKDIDEAVEYINEHSTQHSDSIITENLDNAEKFLNEIDSAAVYLNASTRFSDGGEFGYGGEIGISTQKLHARGPMGVRELTTTKYIIRGNGQIRD